MSLTLEQLALIAKANAQASIRPAIARQSKQTRERAGYCKPLPIGPLTPKAGDSRWALLAKGTVSTFKRNVTQTDCRPKASLGDRRLMRDVANMNEADALYVLPESCPKAGRGIEDLQPVFVELLRLALIKRSDEFELNKEGRLNAYQYRQIKRAAARQDWSKCAEVLQAAMTLNQIG